MSAIPAVLDAIVKPYSSAPLPKRTKTTVGNACDVLWSQIVRERAGHKCEKCPKSAAKGWALHAHHAYGRKDKRLRWEVRNGVCLCYHCHRHWAHEFPIEFTDWFFSKRREDAFYVREERWKGPIKRTLSDYLKLEAELKAMLAQLEKDAA